MDRERLESKSWWKYIHHDLRELLNQSLFLINTVKEIESRGDNKFHDYAFVVFPAAKAYEGFLKRLFLDLGFITNEDYVGKRFRIGRSLNPSLERIYKNESVYDKLVNYLNGKELADLLWNTWKNCRNLLFHWFPNEKNAISYQEAVERVNEVIDAMDKAFEECKIIGKGREVKGK